MRRSDDPLQRTIYNFCPAMLQRRHILGPAIRIRQRKTGQTVGLYRVRCNRKVAGIRDAGDISIALAIDRDARAIVAITTTEKSRIDKGRAIGAQLTDRCIGAT